MEFFYRSLLMANFHAVQLKNRQKIIMSMINTELNSIMFRVNSEFYYEFYYEFYHEMSIKCHDQNSGHEKIHNGNSLIHY